MVRVMNKKRMRKRNFLVMWGIIFLIFYICCKELLIFSIDLFSNNTDNISYNTPNNFKVKNKKINNKSLFAQWA